MKRGEEGENEGRKRWRGEREKEDGKNETEASIPGNLSSELCLIFACVLNLGMESKWLSGLTIKAPEFLCPP